MTIGKKLTVACAALLVMVFGLSLSSLIGTSSLGNALDRAINTTSSKAEAVGAVRSNFESMKADAIATQIFYAIRKLTADPEQKKKHTVDGMECTTCHQGDWVAGHKQRFRQTAAKVQEQLKQIGPWLTTDKERKAVETFEHGVANWASLYEEYIRHADANDFSAAHLTLTQRMLPSVEEVDKATEVLAEEGKAELIAGSAGARSNTARTRWAAIALSALCVLVCAAVFILVLNSTKALRGIATQLGQEAGKVASAAAQMSSSSQSLAQGASEQAAALEETSASMEQMSSVTHKNNDNTRSAAGLMTDSGRAVSAAEQTLREMSASMSEISKAGEKITQVVKLIDDIAFQTKILSLNAAVEAARAGTAGAGFAVVAEQVGHLAQECAEAASSTAEMIESTVVRVRDGVTKLHDVADAIDRVVKHSGEVKILVDEVHVGSNEQAQGIDQVTRAVAQMQQVTQRTAANAEETASAGQELDGRADKLNRLVAQLRVLVGHDAAVAYAPATPETNGAKPSLFALRNAVTDPWKDVAAHRDSVPGDFKEF